jgi:hypothetical protein
MNAQEAVASAFADNNVAVVWDAISPWADVENRTVHLRSIPDLLSDEAVEDVRGDCDHELGHIKFTDPVAFSKIGRKLVKLIANAIEDGRVERLMAEEWFGCGENLERSANRAVSRILLAATDEELNRRRRTLCGLSLIAYGASVDSVVARLGEDIRPAYKQFAVIIDKIGMCRSTEDTVTLATAIADAWRWHPTKLAFGQREEHSTDNQNSQIDTTLEDEASSEIGDAPLSAAAERKSAVAKLLPTTGDVYRAKATYDRVETIRQPSLDVHRLYGAFFDGIRKIVPTLRRRLLMEFRSAGKREARHLKRGKLDDRSLHRVAMDDQRVYKAGRRAIVHRSKVTLLVDCSSSMTHPARSETYADEPIVFRTKLFIAAQAAAAVSIVLDLLRVPNECLAFTTIRAPVVGQPNYERVRPLRHLTIKPFNKSAHACRANFVALGLYEQCAENIDGEAVLWAAKRLLSKPKSGDSPVLIVFSDGDPASQPESKAILAKHLVDSIQRAERSGVAVFGVGVASDAVRSYYKNAVVVFDVGNLVADFYGLLRKVLRERVSSGLRSRV